MLLGYNARVPVFTFYLEYAHLSTVKELRFFHLCNLDIFNMDFLYTIPNLPFLKKTHFYYGLFCLFMLLFVKVLLFQIRKDISHYEHYFF